MKKRIITGIILAIILVPVVYFGNWYFLIFGLLMSGIASFEMMDMFYNKSPSLRIFRYIVPLFSALIVLMIYLINVKSINPDWLTICLIASVILFLAAIVLTKDSQATDMLSIVMTLIYCGLIVGHTIIIRFISETTITTNLFNVPLAINLSGGKLFIYLFLIVIGTDIFAYFFGSKFGKRRLAPSISPKKSVEGAIAGLVSGSFIGTVFVFVSQIVATESVVSNIILALIIFGISALISVVVQLGDLVASKLKRFYDIKDFGYIFPGHGGVLDRFDSLIFSGALFFVIIKLVQLLFI